MTLYDKIIALYPLLTSDDFYPVNGAILLKNDSDGKGDYIAKWDHPEYTRPTQAQLDSIKDA